MENTNSETKLFNFFVDSVLVAVSTEFFKFHSASGVTSVFHSGVTRHTFRAFVRICTTLCTLYGNDNANAFFTCHGFS